MVLCNSIHFQIVSQYFVVQAVFMLVAVQFRLNSMGYFALKICPVDGEQVSVRLQAMSHLLCHGVSQPQFLQLLIATGTEVQRIAAPKNKHHK